MMETDALSDSSAIAVEDCLSPCNGITLHDRGLMPRSDLAQDLLNQELCEASSDCSCLKSQTSHNRHDLCLRTDKNHRDGGDAMLPSRQENTASDSFFANNLLVDDDSGIFKQHRNEESILTEPCNVETVIKVNGRINCISSDCSRLENHSCNDNVCQQVDEMTESCCYSAQSHPDSDHDEQSHFADVALSIASDESTCVVIDGSYLNADVKNANIHLSNSCSRPVNSVETENSSVPLPSGALVRRGSKGSLEKFLAPSLCSVTRSITTPDEDPGFLKVPGYVLGLAVTAEEANTDSGILTTLETITDQTDMLKYCKTSEVEVFGEPHMTDQANVDSAAAIEVTSSSKSKSRRPRPSSLLGLSKPNIELPEAARVEPYSAPAICSSAAFTVGIEAAVPKDSGKLVISAAESSSFSVVTRQRPVFTLAASGVLPGRPSTLSLAKRPTSWSSSQVSAVSSSVASSAKRPCSLNLSFSVAANTADAADKAESVTALSAGRQKSVSAADEQIVRDGEVKQINVSSTHQESSSVTSMVDDTCSAGIIERRQSSELHKLMTASSVNSNVDMPTAQLMEPDSRSLLSPVRPPLSANINLTVLDLGRIPPVWVPDANAPHCMHCGARFTFTRRRHHCRACGKVFCNSCCHVRVKLYHLSNREGRVCLQCNIDLMKGQLYIRGHPAVSSSTPRAIVASHSSMITSSRNPVANRPSSFLPKHVTSNSGLTEGQRSDASQAANKAVVSTISSDEANVDPSTSSMMQDNYPTSTAPVCAFTDAITGAFTRGETYQESKSRETQCKRSPKGRDVDALPQPTSISDARNDIADANVSSSTDAIVDEIDAICQQSALAKCSNGVHSQSSVQKLSVHSTAEQMSSWSTAHLSPVSQLKTSEVASTGTVISSKLLSSADRHDVERRSVSTSDVATIGELHQFRVNANLSVNVTLVNLTCCVNQLCWCISTHGFCTIGRDEVLFVLQCLPHETNIPRELLTYIQTIYEKGLQGTEMNDLYHTVCDEGFLGSSDHAGFLYVRPTYQCLRGLVLPRNPFVIALLFVRSELIWADVFPLRLTLRLGADSQFYPSPLASVRNRQAVYDGVGRTVLSMLSTQKSVGTTLSRLPRVDGMLISMDKKQTVVSIPRSSRSQVIAALDCVRSDHTLALEAEFNVLADSHLVCVQSNDGHCQTQAIQIEGRQRTVTGASFVLFHTPAAGKKMSSSVETKCSIVEDGVMVQTARDAFAALKRSLHRATNYSLTCGQHRIAIHWVDSTVCTTSVTAQLLSMVDGLPLNGSKRHRIQHDIPCSDLPIFLRASDVYYVDGDHVCYEWPFDVCKMEQTVAKVSCSVLNNDLQRLNLEPATAVGLRVVLSSSKLMCEVGINGTTLTDFNVVPLETELNESMKTYMRHVRNVSTLDFVFFVWQQWYRTKNLALRFLLNNTLQKSHIGQQTRTRIGTG